MTDFFKQTLMKLLILLLLPFSLFSQNKKPINSTLQLELYNMKSEPIAGAMLILINKKDTFMMVTSAEGICRDSVRSGKYKGIITSIGYDTKKIYPIVIPENKNMTLLVTMNINCQVFKTRKKKSPLL